MKKINGIIFLYLITVLLIGCSSKSDQDYYNEAQLKIKEMKFTEAAKEFEMLAEEYPQSEMAPKAVFEIAKLYHAQLIPGLNKEESFIKAVKFYKRVYEKFSSTKEAENALFMAGFIQANELNMLDSAKINYELFLDKFPESQMAVSVRLELDNLGLRPEEILKKSDKKY